MMLKMIFVTAMSCTADMSQKTIKNATIITDTDKKILDILKATGEFTGRASEIGALIYPEGGVSRTRQGLALCGMRAVRRLQAKKVIDVCSDINGFVLKIRK